MPQGGDDCDYCGGSGCTACRASPFFFQPSPHRMSLSEHVGENEGRRPEEKSRTTKTAEARLLDELIIELKRGSRTVPGWETWHHEEAWLFNLVDHRLVIEVSSVTLSVWLVVEATDPDERCKSMHGLAGFTHWELGPERPYLTVAPCSRFQPVYDMDKWHRKECLNPHNGCIDGPWWNHIEEVIIPKLRAHNDAIEDAEAKRRINEKRNKEAAERRALKSWRPAG